MTFEEECNAKVSKKFLEAMKDDAFADQLILSDRLYVELGLLRDLDIGGMFTVAYLNGEAMKRELHAIIRSNLDAYCHRVFFDPYHYFPHPMIKKEDVIDIVVSQKHLHDLMFAYAATTNFIDSLKANLMINRNNRQVVNKTGDILVTINTWPLKLSSNVETIYGMYLMGQFDGLQTAVDFICKDPNELTLDEIDKTYKFDEFYVYNFKRFIENKEISQAASEMHFTINTRLFTIPILGDKFIPLMAESRKQRDLILIESHMKTLFRHFCYIPVDSVSPVRKIESTEDTDEG